MTTYRDIAPAKINLTLEILGRRSDGYHELQSLVVFARDCADGVELDTGKAAGVACEGPFAGSIEGGNLLSKVLALSRTAEPQLTLGALTLTKALPVASGIGGGSADAAAALRLIRTANPEFAQSLDWLGLAAKIGADVPVCLESRASFMTGVGENVVTIAAFPELSGLLVNPQMSVPADKTAQVFRALAAGPLGCGHRSPQVPRFSGKSEVAEYMSRHTNGLMAPATKVVPAIGGVLSALAAIPQCRMARLSGAGPTCFGLFDSFEDASAAARVIQNRHPSWWVRPTCLS